MLFDEVSLVFSPGNRYGLTGANGSGKSTLLKILMKIEEPTSGSVSTPKKVGFLQQNIEEYRDDSLLDVVCAGNQRLWSALRERERLYEGEVTDRVGLRLGELEEIIAEEDGYAIESDVELLLSGLSVPVDSLMQPMHQLPFDMQFRVLLCQALFGKPEALFLDEPTNYLDLNSISWLEGFLRDYEGTLIVISHDRHFLNAVSTHIANVDYETVIVYPGNYDQMLETKVAAYQKLEMANRSREKKIGQLQTFVARFGSGSRASQVQSRIREIRRLQPQELKKSNIQVPYISFPSPHLSSGRVVLRGRKVSKQFKGRQVIKDFSIEILRGEKVILVGNNGMGKTTLLRMLAQLLSPDQGEVDWGHQVTMGYFPQSHSDLIPKETMLSAYHWLKTQCTSPSEQEVRDVMGKMLFKGDDSFKPISALSGGETARLILASLMLRGDNLLFLDEPHNHLDLESVSALGKGLQFFSGTLVMAAHDRELINEVKPTRILLVEGPNVSQFSGSLEELLSR